MSNVAIVQRRLLELGYSPNQVAGIIGNLQQESGRGLNPNVVGDKGTAYGIAQWRGPRFEGLQSFAQQRGIDWRDPALQADYIHHELNTTERRAGELLRSAKTPEESARAFIGFERPAGFTWNNPTAGHGWDNRLKNAYALSGDPAPSFEPAPRNQMADASDASMTPTASQDWNGYQTPTDNDLRSLLDNYEAPEQAAPKEPMQAPTLAANAPSPGTANMLANMLMRRRPISLI